ncbi:MAG: hypothetical protein FJ028_01350 [Chloroflexi bacterium]|nr:hypothetical protein [Chloroflexota bacterium]
MEGTLRPLGVGDIVDRVFGTYRQRPLMFLAVAAIPFLVLVLVLIVGVLTATFAAGAIVALAPFLSGNVDPERPDPARLLQLLGPLLAFVAIVAVAAIGVSLVVLEAEIEGLDSDSAVRRVLARLDVPR